MSVRISFTDLSLAALDGLKGTDALALFLFEDERPLGGAAGYCDWRLCGGLSRVLKEGRFTGAANDVLLLPSQARLPAPRLFVFGLGRRSQLNEELAAGVLRRAAQTLSLAQSRSVALHLPFAPALEVEAQARLVLAEALPRFRGDRLLFLVEGRALQRAFVARHSAEVSVDDEPVADPVPMAVAPRQGKARAG